MAQARPLRQKRAASAVPVLRRDDLHVRAKFVEPAGNLELRLAEFWREILNVDLVGSQDDYFDLGGDSLMATELFLQLERWVGIRLATSEILEHSTIAKLAARLGGESQLDANRCLLQLQTEGANPPLFVVQDMSGGVLSYRHCLARLGNRRKVFGLQYPGLVEGATSVLSFPELAARFAEVVMEAWPNGPYNLAGYSMGAQIAFATANSLRAAGGEVSLLALIDGPTRKGKVGGLRREARKLARGLFNLADVKVERWPNYLLKSSGREMRRIWKKKRRKSKEPFTPTFASLIDEQSRLYSPPIYPGPVKVLRSTDEAEYFNRKYLGWDDFVTGPIEVFDISAHHANIMTEPRAALVAAYLERWLREADQARKR